MNKHLKFARRSVAVALSAVAVTSGLSACAPLLMGGAAVTSTMVAVDRRSSGVQLDDQGIELRASNRLSDQLGGARARVSVTSYNRRVLLTGEAASEADKAKAEAIVKGVENVAMVYNELAISNSPTFSEKAGDAFLTAKVKTGLLERKELSSNSFKVVSEHGTVYLMGRVTQREADMATDVARTTKDVQRVVRVMEILSEEELLKITGPK